MLLSRLHADLQIRRSGSVAIERLRSPLLQRQPGRWLTKVTKRADNDSRARPESKKLASPTRLRYNAIDRSLLRSILRESAYFPDQSVQIYVRQQAIKRFRVYHNKSSTIALDAEYRQRLQHARRDARQALHLLQRANIGDMKAFRVILLKTYGRRGERRRTLMEKLMRSHNSVEDANKRSAQPTMPRTDAWKRYAPTMTPQLEALAISQNRANIHFGSITKVRLPGSLKPKIPAVNAWHKPMPLVRVKNMTHDWWAEFADRIMPPLPPHEWYRLYALATGKILASSSVRKTGGAAHDTPDPLEYVAVDKTNRRWKTENKERSITDRSAQRAYVEVFRMTPMMKYDGDWKITWGKEVLFNHAKATSIEKQYQEHLATSAGVHE